MLGEEREVGSAALVVAGQMQKCLAQLRLEGAAVGQGEVAQAAGVQRLVVPVAGILLAALQAAGVMPLTAGAHRDLLTPAIEDGRPECPVFAQATNGAQMQQGVVAVTALAAG